MWRLFTNVALLFNPTQLLKLIDRGLDIIITFEPFHLVPKGQHFRIWMFSIYSKCSLFHPTCAMNATFDHVKPRSKWYSHCYQWLKGKILRELGENTHWPSVIYKWENPDLNGGHSSLTEGGRANLKCLSFNLLEIDDEKITIDFIPK